MPSSQLYPLRNWHPQRQNRLLGRPIPPRAFLRQSLLLQLFVWFSTESREKIRLDHWFQALQHIRITWGGFKPPDHRSQLHQWGQAAWGWRPVISRFLRLLRWLQCAANSGNHRATWNKYRSTATKDSESTELHTTNPKFIRSEKVSTTEFQLR